MKRAFVLIGFFMILSIAGCGGSSSGGEKGEGQGEADSTPFNDDETADFEAFEFEFLCFHIYLILF